MSSDKNLKKRILAFFIFSVLYFIGFIFQLFGLVSITETNIIIMLVLFLFFWFNSAATLKFIILYFNLLIILLLFIVSLIVTYLFYTHGFIKLLVYFYYVLVLFSSMAFSYIICNSDYFNKNSWSNVIIIFLIVQVLFAFLQYNYSDFFISISQVPIIKLDIVSGAFFIKSDATLVLVVNLLVMHLFVNNFSFALRCFSIIALALISFFADSKALQLLSIVNILFLIIVSVFSINKFSSYLRFYFFVISIFLILAVFFIFKEDLFKVIDESLFEIYNSRFAGYGAHRLAGLSEFIYGDIGLFGEGLLTYQNPITSDWLYYSGHSAVYSLYMDTGLIGFSLFSLFFIYLIINLRLSYSCKIIIFLFLIAYSLFNFMITDFAGLIAIFMFMFLNSYRPLKVSFFKSKKVLS